MREYRGSGDCVTGVFHKNNFDALIISRSQEKKKNGVKNISLIKDSVEVKGLYVSF